LGGVPSKIMVDNLKSAVLQRLAGAAPVFNPRYLDFARHHGFAIAACNVARGNEKGRVESGVGYIKKNFLHGLEVTDFSAVQAAAQLWLDNIANVRIHGETQKRPVDLLAHERTALRPLSPHPYDIAQVSTSVASSQFRITLDTNHYSVPAAYAHRRVTVKAYPDRICIYYDSQLIVRHTRQYGRHQDIEDPEHAKALVAQRSHAREQRLMLRFLALSPDAQAYYDGLEQRRLNARNHLRKILALAEIYAPDAVARAISDGLAFDPIVPGFVGINQTWLHDIRAMRPGAVFFRVRPSPRRRRAPVCGRAPTVDRAADAYLKSLVPFAAVGCGRRAASRPRQHATAGYDDA
jgi:hypothetical protein